MLPVGNLGVDKIGQCPPLPAKTRKTSSKGRELKNLVRDIVKTYFDYSHVRADAPMVGHVQLCPPQNT